MEKFTVTLTRMTTEQADIDIEAETLQEAQEIALDRYHAGEFDDDFSMVDSEITSDQDDDQGEDEGISSLSRLRKIESLIKAGDYEEETAARDILADLRHYCDAKGIVYGTEDKAAYQHYLHELKFDE